MPRSNATSRCVRIALGIVTTVLPGLPLPVCALPLGGGLGFVAFPPGHGGGLCAGTSRLRVGSRFLKLFPPVNEPSTRLNAPEAVPGQAVGVGDAGVDERERFTSDETVGAVGAGVSEAAQVGERRAVTILLLEHRQEFRIGCETGVEAHPRQRHFGNLRVIFCEHSLWITSFSA